MSRILVVENEPALADAMDRCLQHDGHTVNVVSIPRAGLGVIDRFRPDLIILDVIHPGRKWIGLCRNIRAQTRIPIILLAASQEGLEELLDSEVVAVDDYLTKPLRPRELAARVKAVLGCVHPRDQGNGEALSFRDLRISPGTRSVEMPHRRVKLTPKEFDLLRFLASHPGRIYSREQLLYHVWDDSSWADPSTITIHIRRLRLKVEQNPEGPRHLKTVWGTGYTFEP